MVCAHGLFGCGTNFYGGENKWEREMIFNNFDQTACFENRRLRSDTNSECALAFRLAENNCRFHFAARGPRKRDIENSSQLPKPRWGVRENTRMWKKKEEKDKCLRVTRDHGVYIRQSVQQHLAWISCVKDRTVNEGEAPIYKWEVHSI